MSTARIGLTCPAASDRRVGIGAFKTWYGVMAQAAKDRGAHPVGNFFCDDHTHFSPTGAVDIAALVAGAVRAQIPGLAGYLK
jgi:hypothetical protein